MTYMPTINSASSMPVFLQIENQLEEAILTGELEPHTKIPSERQMAEHLGVSRGTVKKAYDNLIKAGLLDVRRGAGCFVMPVDRTPRSRMDQAQEVIQQTIFELEKLHFAHRKIGEIFTTELSRRIESLRNFSVVTLDCNPEALEVYHRQLGTLSYATHSEKLLAHLEQEPNPTAVLASYDFIITTQNHYHDVLNLVPSLSDKVFSVGVSPSSETLVAIGSIAPDHRIGIIHRSERFKKIIIGWIRKFHPNNEYLTLNPSTDPEDTSFFDEIDVLIVPLSTKLGFKTFHLENLRRLREQGGKIIQFEYRIEPGSLSHLEHMLLTLSSRAD